MKKPLYTWLFPLALVSGPAFSQTNILSTNPVAEQVLLGDFDPAGYASSGPISDAAVIAAALQDRISPDSLKTYITRLSEFQNRNTGSDTLSATTGIGAARRWVYQHFQAISAMEENRLIPSYLQFDQTICSVNRHRNIFAVLPGADTANHGVIIVEGHMDSRCAEVCDIACLAQGVEDNATGTALVLELARVMSRYTFAHTIVFLVTIGEEQGLDGAEAFASYVQAKGISLRAVLNNDVIGGVICGQTSSPPSCPGFNNVDSTSVRLFSGGSFNSRHKQLARYIKLEYQENLLPQATVPMNVRIMSPIDRTGRGGDHIPFTQKNYPSMRFTSANEHGDASLGPGYTDRQHTSGDILGVDTGADGAVDSFFVQFNYLSRNALINANAIAMAARAVRTPTDFTATRSGTLLTVNITDPWNAGLYRVGARSTTNDWDTVYTLSGTTSGMFISNPSGPLYVSVAAVDGQGIESLFSMEKLIALSGTETPAEEAGSNRIRLLQNRPNPFDEATWISFWVPERPDYRAAEIRIVDSQGKLIAVLPVILKQGLNEVLYTHGYGQHGNFIYTLWIDGQRIDSRQMIFAN